MNRKDIALPILAAVLGGLLALPVTLLMKTDWLGGLAAVGEVLRALSLSGTGGNIAAWAIVVAVSLLPALGLLWRGRKRWDWLLLVAGAELFAGLYFLVNPALLLPEGSNGFGADAMAKMWGLVFFGCVLGTLAAWVLLRLLGSLEGAPARLLPKVLLWAGLLCAAAVGFAAVSGLVTDIAAVKEGNTVTSTIMADLAPWRDAMNTRVENSALLLALVALLELIPQVMGAVVILWGGRLAAALSDAPFEEGTVALAETLSVRCMQVAKASLLLSVAGNLLQMLCLPRVAAVHVTIQLPVLTFAICAVLLLLCRYFRRAKAVSDDNATII